MNGGHNSAENGQDTFLHQVRLVMMMMTMMMEMMVMMMLVMTRLAKTLFCVIVVVVVMVILVTLVIKTKHKIIKNFEMNISLRKLNYDVENEEDNEEYKVGNSSTKYWFYDLKNSSNKYEFLSILFNKKKIFSSKES